MAIAIDGSSLGDQVADRLRDLVDRRNNSGFERRAIRRGGMSTVEPAYRCVEVVKAPVRELGRDLGADAERRERFVHDEQPSRLGDRLRDRRDIERRDGPRVDQLNRNTLRLELSGGLQDVMDHESERHDRDVSAPPHHRGLAESDLIIALPEPVR